MRSASRRLQLDAAGAARVLDMGCGLGATLRSLARKLPKAELTGITRVPWQVEQATRLNEQAGCTSAFASWRGIMSDLILLQGRWTRRTR